MTVDQHVFVVPQLSIKELLAVIPAHCFKRSAIKSGAYVLYDLVGIACAYKVVSYADAFVTASAALGPLATTLAKFSLWSLYGFTVGLFGTGLWIIAHECGHQAFSESKALNNAVGWVLHSALGIPYHSWRITHAKHHASTGHLTQDQVYVPWTRSQAGLPPLNPEKEDILGRNVAEEVKSELFEAMGDSPIGAFLMVIQYLLLGFPVYLLMNAEGQQRYPKFTNHFKPTSVMFAPHQYNDIVISDLGILIWLGTIVASICVYGFGPVFRNYLVPYLWVNHWLVLITFLQHTDPLLPHYRASDFNFVRGALCTIDRSLLGDLGPVAGWIGATLTHGISETHVLHHLCSKIPHYNAWEASDALKAKLESAGVSTKEGGAGGWKEMYRVLKECKFVEDEGGIVFFKNAHGLAAARPVFVDNTANDSGIEVETE
ncbi:fatty acid desaturase [Athelia psychrophila]|uniref:Fatty acid desaturase n=1 Tax=Athelia psychrophila TaxID=1759441 RepID=A0A167UCF6_9AGAM|nr:fatty acid desaturase [Fibularhizoctonia sp. CBS 109695]KZP29669.1 fatty acid desaturase [Fibularhizoctonia sp. CBS 109695]